MAFKKKGAPTYGSLGTLEAPPEQPKPEAPPQGQPTTKDK